MVFHGISIFGSIQRRFLSFIPIVILDDLETLVDGEKGVLAGVFQYPDNHLGKNLIGAFDDGRVADVERVERARVHGNALMGHVRHLNTGFRSETRLNDEL